MAYEIAQTRYSLIFSSKGGTGKSFLTANLAVALSVKTGTDTAVLDGDLDMGDIFSYFGRELVKLVGVEYGF